MERRPDEQSKVRAAPVAPPVPEILDHAVRHLDPGQFDDLAFLRTGGAVAGDWWSRIEGDTVRPASILGRNFRRGRGGHRGFALSRYPSTSRPALLDVAHLRHADDHYLARPAPGYGEAATSDHLQLGWAFWLVGHSSSAAPHPGPTHTRSGPRRRRPRMCRAGCSDRTGRSTGCWPRPGVQPARPALVPRGRGPRVFVAASAGPRSGRGACRWARLRTRSVSRRARAPATCSGWSRSSCPPRYWPSSADAGGWPGRRSRRSHSRDSCISRSAQSCSAVATYGRGCREANGAGPSSRPAVAAGAGLLVQQAVVAGSIAAGRSFAQVERYSAEVSDFVTRGVSGGIEELVFVGWLAPLLAVVGWCRGSTAAGTGLAARPRGRRPRRVRPRRQPARVRAALAWVPAAARDTGARAVHAACVPRAGRAGGIRAGACVESAQAPAVRGRPDGRAAACLGNRPAGSRVRRRRAGRGVAGVRSDAGGGQAGRAPGDPAGHSPRQRLPRLRTTVTARATAGLCDDRPSGRRPLGA